MKEICKVANSSEDEDHDSDVENYFKTLASELKAQEGTSPAIADNLAIIVKQVWQNPMASEKLKTKFKS